MVDCPGQVNIRVPSPDSMVCTPRTSEKILRHPNRYSELNWNILIQEEMKVRNVRIALFAVVAPLHIHISSLV
jgi:hypothetical protein